MIIAMIDDDNDEDHWGISGLLLAGKQFAFSSVPRSLCTLNTTNLIIITMIIIIIITIIDHH